MPNRGSLILITGAMAAGKSTVAQHLAERMDRSVHLRGDVFRRMVVNGRVDMSSEPSLPAMNQLMLRYRAAAETAKLYVDAGFSVVYQDVIVGPVLDSVAQMFAGFSLHVVVLCPTPETIAAREAARDKQGYTKVTITQLQQALADTPRIGLWIDSSNQTVEETVDAILDGLSHARVPDYSEG
jgi:chloramphenicol 3-O-phosphotransferase